MFKLLLEVTKGASYVKVHYNSQLDEFKASLFINGKHYEPADYFTDDREDCVKTAHSMLASKETE